MVGWPGFGPFWGFWVFAVLFNLAFWGGLVLLVVWAVRQFRPGGGARGVPSGEALRILEERFARGEIDADEFQRRRDILSGRTG